MEEINNNNPKQIIIMRTDLNMRKGKMIAQGAHAAMCFLSELITTNQLPSAAEQEWLQGSFKKICVQIDSEALLLQIISEAQKANLKTKLIYDSGLTEFHGTITLTCCAIGPDYPEKIDPITKHLKLL